MIVKKASEITHKPTLNFLVYGDPKIGKSTFATKSDKVLVADCEAGYRFMGLRGLDCDIATIETWDDIREFYSLARSGDYDLIVIDPVNELLEKLMAKAKKVSVYVQNTDKESLSIKGWGFVKSTMKITLKAFRDLNKNVLFVAHVKMEEHDGVMKKQPKLDANLASELMAMIDVVGYMRIITSNGQKKRIITFSSSETYDAGDRTEVLPREVDADIGFKGVYNIIAKNPKYAQKNEKVVQEEEDMPEEDAVDQEIKNDPVKTKNDPVNEPVEEIIDPSEEQLEALEIKDHDSEIKKQQEIISKKNKIINYFKLEHPAITKQKDREDEIKKMTGLEFVPENYDLIIEKLK